MIETVAHAQKNQLYRADRSHIGRQEIEKYGHLLALSPEGEVDLFGRDFYSSKADNPTDALLRARQRIEHPFVAAVIQDESLYLTNHKEGCHAYLIRGGNARRVTAPNADGVYLPIALKKGDTILLCVGSACQVLSTDRIKVGGLPQTARQISSKAKNPTDSFILAQLRSTAALTVPQQLILSVLAIIALLQLIALMLW